MSNYILQNKVPVKCEDIREWGNWMSKNNRCVIRTDRGTMCVSTVFLGADYNFGDDHPLFFESMVFADYPEMTESDCNRYSTWEEARIGHIEMCKKWFGEYTEEDLFLDTL